jgi:hypothetical protein
MAKIIKYAGAYILWIADLGLTFWLIFISRTVYLGIFGLFYRPGAWAYSHRVDLADKVFLLILGLGWLVFMIIVEADFRAGARREDLLKRFARVTGPVLLSIFGVDLILFWLQGVAGGNWLRWSILAAELGFGIALLVSARPQPKPNPI